MHSADMKVLVEAEKTSSLSVIDMIKGRRGV
jgi:hypothetical protein